MDAPQYKQPALDPAYATLMQQSQQQDIAAIKTGVQMDTASLLARYGTRLAIAGMNGTGGAAGIANPAALQRQA